MTFWLRTWQLGTKSLLLHPLRSLLTVLGIFIGVASVIWLLAIGEGISRKAQEQIEGLGANNIIVRSIKPPNEATSNVRGPVPYGITREDYQRLTETIPTIDRVLPIREIRRRFSFGSRMVDGRLVGCTPEYAEVTKLDLDRGHFITDAEVRQKQNHCVLSSEVAERLFPFEDPLGRAIHIEEAYYVVVGVMKSRQPTAGVGGSLAAQDFRNDVYIPITTLWSRIGDCVYTRRSGSFEGEIVELSQATLRVDQVENVLTTSELVKQTLAKFHRTEDYGLTVPLELLEQAKTTRMMFILFLGMIAAISLVVGGIGIMNIMLATVTERTREIGIRRAPAPAPRHHPPVPRGDDRPVDRGRTDGDSRRPDLPAADGLDSLGDGNGNARRRQPLARRDPHDGAGGRSHVDPPGFRHLGDDRRGLRPLPGPPCRRHGPDRSPAPRVRRPRSPRPSGEGVVLLTSNIVKVFTKGSGFRVFTQTSPQNPEPRTLWLRPCRDGALHTVSNRFERLHQAIDHLRRVPPTQAQPQASFALRHGRRTNRRHQEAALTQSGRQLHGPLRLAHDERDDLAGRQPETPSLGRQRLTKFRSPGEKLDAAMGLVANDLQGRQGCRGHRRGRGRGKHIGPRPVHQPLDQRPAAGHKTADRAEPPC